MTPARPEQTTVEVAAGLIFRDGRLLLARRPAGTHLAGLWEFPGGKRHPDETYPQCLARELREELGVDVEVGECLERITHQYPGRRVHLEFFRCRLRAGEPQPRGCAALAWVSAVELDRYEFPAADARLVAKLRQRADWWTSAP